MKSSEYHRLRIDAERAKVQGKAEPALTEEQVEAIARREENDEVYG